MAQATAERTDFLDSDFDEDVDPQDELQDSFSSEEFQRKYSTLASFSAPIKAPARDIVGRDYEISQLMAAMSRPELCNALLLAPPGSGKTALVQAAMLKDTERIYLEIDLARMISGLKSPDEMAALIKKLFDDAEKYSDNETSQDLVLFIDEFHQIVQLSAAAVEALKPVLAASGARGIRIIAATTFEEFHEHIAKNQPLVERLQRINVNPPDQATTIKILQGMATRYGVGHKFVDTHIFEMIYEYTNRYMPASTQPRKSILVLDAMVGWHKFSGRPMDKALLADVLRESTNVNVAFRVDAVEMKSKLDKKVFSQHLATSVVAKRLQLCVADLHDKTKPMSSFLFTGPTGTGKAHPVDEVVAVDDDRKYIKFGDVRIGDRVFSREGQSIEVTGLFPQGELPVYEVRLDDGRSAWCSDGHLWTVLDKTEDRLRTISVKDMIAEGLTDFSGESEFFVPDGAGTVRTGAVDGSWLAAGLYAFTDGGHDDCREQLEAGGEVTDPEDLDYASFQLAVGEMPDDRLDERYNEAVAISEAIFGGHLSWDLLRFDKSGLTAIIDHYFSYGPGWSSGGGSHRLDVAKSFDNRETARIFAAMHRAVGLRAVLADPDPSDPAVSCGDPSTKVEVWVECDIEREGDADGRVSFTAIESIEPLGHSAEMVCIMVDHPEHLYQVGYDHVVTHNTELTKQLAHMLFGHDQGHLIRFDMSEYANEDSLDLFRSELTKRVWDMGHAVLLFDEIEKAAGSVVRVMLQVLDDGRLSDDHGRQVSFLNTYIILTTNAGSEIYATIAKYNVDDTGSGDQLMSKMREIKRSIVTTQGDNKFPPELMGRIDAVVPFQPLSRPTQEKIVHNKLKQLVQEVLTKHGVRIKIQPKVLEYLIENKADVESDAGGARDAIGKMTDEVTTNIAAFINAHPQEKVIRVEVEGTMKSEDKTMLVSQASIKVFAAE